MNHVSSIFTWVHPQMTSPSKPYLSCCAAPTKLNQVTDNFLDLSCTQSFSSWQHDTHWAADTLTPGLPLWVTQSDVHTTLGLSEGLRGREQPRIAKFHTRQRSRKNTLKTHLRDKNCFSAAHSGSIHIIPVVVWLSPCFSRPYYKDKLQPFVVKLTAALIPLAHGNRYTSSRAILLWPTNI